MPTEWKMTLHESTWSVQKIVGEELETPIVMMAGQTFVVTPEKPGMTWRGGMGAQGPDRWSLFSDDEIKWLALGMSVADGEGLLPPRDATADAFAEFELSLSEADARRNG